MLLFKTSIKLQKMQLEKEELIDVDELEAMFVFQVICCFKHE